MDEVACVRGPLYLLVFLFEMVTFISPMKADMCRSLIQIPEPKPLHINHIISYHIVDLKRQNRLKVGTKKPKLKVKMQSVSDDDVRKRLLEQTRFELAAKGVFRLGRCYIIIVYYASLLPNNAENQHQYSTST